VGPGGVFRETETFLCLRPTVSFHLRAVGRSAGLPRKLLSTPLDRWASRVATKDDDEDEDLDDDGIVALSTVPFPEWVPWLRTIHSNIREHINPPSCLGSGHRALADKAAAEVYKWALQEPLGAPLSAHSSSYISHTSDMGVELGLPEFIVPEGVERLLPGWLHRSGLQPESFEDLDQVWHTGWRESS
jgi:hypothetical protein